MARALITGLGGFVASHLTEYLLANTDWEITGTMRWSEPLDNLRPSTDTNRPVEPVFGDLTDAGSMHSAVKATKPDYVFHLAAQSYPHTSFEAPAETLRTNVEGTLNLLEAVRHNAPEAWVHVCSSSEVYGRVPAEQVPIREACGFHPASPYAISKAGTDMLGRYYAEAYRLKTIVTRMFTHTGPRRGDVFAESAFAKQIAALEAGAADGPVRVGNVDSVRTFADVRDAVRAYWLLLERCPAGEVYNIGGERTMTIGQMLEVLKGMARCRVEHVIDPALVRPSDVTLQIPDTAKFRAATGWQPEIPFEDTMRDLLAYHRCRLRDPLTLAA